MDDTSKEFTDGYWYTIKVRDEYGRDTGQTEEEWCPMGSPVCCSYQVDRKANNYNKGGETVYLHNHKHESITCHEQSNDINSSPPSRPPKRVKVERDKCAVVRNLRTELRGITLRQLRAIWMNVQRRCEIEKWTNRGGELISPDQVNLYDASKYVIKPFTEGSQCSFVEALPSTAGPQPPRWFVSHCWEEPIKDFMVCLEQHNHDFWRNNNTKDHDDRGGGMTIDTPYWICAYAVNQWDIDNSITMDPSQSPFTKAMEIAKYRTVSILDNKGKVFNRIWCVYELYLTLLAKKDEKSSSSEWAIYTAHQHQFEYKGRKWSPICEPRDAVGIISGDGKATTDICGASESAARESHFPFELILQSFGITIETAEASEEHDRVHILNAIVGKTEDALDDDPFKEHEKYASLNDLIRTSFASSYGALQAARRKGGRNWTDTLTLMSKGTMMNYMNFDFRPGNGWDDMTTDEAVQLIKHLPLTIQGLAIFCAEFKPEFIHALSDWIRQTKNLKSLAIHFLEIPENREAGRGVGSSLARALTSSRTIETVCLNETNLIGSRNASDWAEFFSRSKSVKNFICHGLSEFAGYKENPTPKFFTVRNKHLYLGGIFPDGMLTDEGFMILAKGIESSVCLEKLEFQNHGMGKNIMAALRSTLKVNESIREIIFWEDDMNETKKESFENALKKIDDDYNVAVRYKKCRPLYDPTENKK